jgi:hypothetical protein
MLRLAGPAMPAEVAPVGRQLLPARLVNDDLGTGACYEIPAPVAVPENHPCPDYSSSVLSADGGRAIPRVAADFTPDGQCRAYFAKGPAA